MRTFRSLVVTVVGLWVIALWWRAHPRVGTDLMNRTVNPWLERHGFIRASRGELALIEHVGRTSGIVRSTPVHPVPTADGFRIIVPVGTRSQWARNVLAAGQCALTIGDRRYALIEPVLEAPAAVPMLPRPVKALFGWLGFRFLRLRTVAETPVEPPLVAGAPVPVEQPVATAPAVAAEPAVAAASPAFTRPDQVAPESATRRRRRGRTAESTRRATPATPV